MARFSVRVLHLFSDWRWTGPADPTILLCRTLRARGWDVLLACRRPPREASVSILQKCLEHGVPVTTELRLNRYLSVRDLVWDLWGLRRFVRTGGFGLIHCHLSHDHFLGAWTSRMCRVGVPVIRTNHKARPLRRDLWNLLLLGRWTDGLIEFSRNALSHDVVAFGLDEQMVELVNPAVDCEFFDPSKADGEQVRAQLGIGEREVLAGIVARVQRHRRFEVLLEAMALLKDQNPPIKLMIVGKGTHRETVAVKPARRMGLSHMVIFPGYRRDDYRDFVAAMDIKVFLVPGSDGTCRAVREAMAMGKPVVCTRRGMLPELVDHGVNGLVVDEDPQSIADAILRLARDPHARERMGRAARDKAQERFSLERQARRVESFYLAVLGRFRAQINDANPR
jgi:glycosyltransferase involved in cell wall biosynthesis